MYRDFCPTVLQSQLKHPGIINNATLSQKTHHHDPEKKYCLITMKNEERQTLSAAISDHKQTGQKE